MGVSKIAYMEQDHKQYQHAFSVEKGGYGPATNWYRAVLRDINEEDEKSMYHFPLYHVSPSLSLPFSLFAWKFSSITYDFRIPTYMQCRTSQVRAHLNTPSLANCLDRLHHHCRDQLSGADAATRS
jgi:hypothetical protein